MCWQVYFFLLLSILVTEGCESIEVATFNPNRIVALIFTNHVSQNKGVYPLLSWTR
jgi:hypothetical protein